MNQALVRLAIVFAVCATAGVTRAAEKDEDPAHTELRNLRDNLIKAVNAGTPEQLLPYLDEDIVVTWQNGEVSRKPAGVKEYYNRMMKGEKRIVEKVSSAPVVDELAHLYGDTAVATGRSKDHFKLTDGREFDFNDRWTATVVKKGDKWLLTSFHISENLFDNPVMKYAVRTAATWAGVGTLVVGLLVGMIVHRIRSPRGKVA